MSDGHHFVHRITDSRIHFVERIHCADDSPSTTKDAVGKRIPSPRKSFFSSTNIDDFLQHRSTACLSLSRTTFNLQDNVREICSCQSGVIRGEPSTTACRIVLIQRVGTARRPIEVTLLSLAAQSTGLTRQPSRTARAMQSPRLSVGSSIAITTPPGPVSHRTKPHLRVKL